MCKVADRVLNFGVQTVQYGPMAIIRSSRKVLSRVNGIPWSTLFNAALTSRRPSSVSHTILWTRHTEWRVRRIVEQALMKVFPVYRFPTTPPCDFFHKWTGIMDVRNSLGQIQRLMEFQGRLWPGCRRVVWWPDQENYRAHWLLLHTEAVDRYLCCFAQWYLRSLRRYWGLYHHHLATIGGRTGQLFKDDCKLLNKRWSWRLRYRQQWWSGHVQLRRN